MVHPVGVATLVSAVAAQFLKPFVDLAMRRGFHFIRVFDTGGMPSSHTAAVTTLTAGVAVFQGVSSPLFGISLVFSLYFVFEATGLRQEVGNQARVLNEIIERVRETHHLNAEELRELIGHTWSEVIGGFVLGLAVALLMY
ncbi:MAG: divergent PAP2 family protein [Candidatus Krumholzibacteriota bacterium]|nr:divergent PAP2 family protein [Candidatus Krumholzibacteriota bacterium]